MLICLIILHDINCCKFQLFVCPLKRVRIRACEVDTSLLHFKEETEDSCPLVHFSTSACTEREASFWELKLEHAAPVTLLSRSFYWELLLDLVWREQSISNEILFFVGLVLMWCSVQYIHTNQVFQLKRVHFAP